MAVSISKSKKIAKSKSLTRAYSENVSVLVLKLCIGRAGTNKNLFLHCHLVILYLDTC
jgi:hypothetical protein